MAEGVEGEDGGLVRGGLYGGVSGVVDGFASEGFDLGAEVAEAVFAAGGDDEVCPMLSEGDGGGVADARTGSGDEGYLVAEGDGDGLLRHACWAPTVDANIRLC